MWTQHTGSVEIERALKNGSLRTDSLTPMCNLANNRTTTVPLGAHRTAYATTRQLNSYRSFRHGIKPNTNLEKDLLKTSGFRLCEKVLLHPTEPFHTKAVSSSRQQDGPLMNIITSCVYRVQRAWQGGEGDPLP